MIELSVIPNLNRAGYDKIGAGRGLYDAVVNWSTLKILGAKTPAHYRYAIEEGAGTAEETDAQLLGRAVHVAALEPEAYASSFDVWKGGKRDLRQEVFRDFMATAILQGRDVITADQHREAKRIARAARLCEAAQPFLPGKREISITFQFVRAPMLALAGYSIDCKARLDLLCDNGAILDLKSTRDGSPEGFAKEIARYGYHLQAALYRHGYQLASGEKSPRPYYLLAVENEPPYVPQLYRLGDGLLAFAHSKVVEMFDLLAFCRREKKWPGYFDAAMILDLEDMPRWSVPHDDGFDLQTGEVTLQ